MTDAQFAAWLADPTALRLVLIETSALVGAVETPFYFSTRGAFVTGPADTPASTVYQGGADVAVLYTESLSLPDSGAAGLQAGEVDIDNYGGARDDYLTYVWANRPFTAYVGDARWPKSDFRVVFSGVVADVVPNGRDKLTFALRDKLQRLNASLSERTVGDAYPGTTVNADTLVPITLGECHNVTPLLVDPANLTYEWHIGVAARLIEVRDNAVPVAAAADLANGRFSLASPSAGQVTCSVQGDATGSYASTAATLAQRLATAYGKLADRFGLADLDTASLASFDASHPQPLGLYVDGRANLLDCIIQLAASVGAQPVITGTGLLRLVALDAPVAGGRLLDASVMAERSLTPAHRYAPVGAVKLAYCRNWTVQTGLVTDIPEEHKRLYEQEWLTVAVADDTVVANWRQSSEPAAQQETLLLTKSDASAEANRRLALWRVARTRFEFDGLPVLLDLQLGDAVTLKHPRFGLAGGKPGEIGRAHV